MQTYDMLLDNERENRVILVPEEETEEARRELKEYNQKLLNLLGISDRFTLGREGTFWNPDKLYGIYLAIKRHFPKLNCEKIVQIAGGPSPLLYALSQIHPKSIDKLVGVDIDPYFRETFGKKFPYPLITMDIRELKNLKLNGPSVVFSYHFLDCYWLSNFREWQIGTEENTEQNVDSMLEALPKGSIMISQPEAAKTTIEDHLKRFSDTNDVTGFLLNHLNKKKYLEVEIMATEYLSGIYDVLLISKVK